MALSIQDALFASLEQAMWERHWRCPRCGSAAHPALHAYDIVLRCSNIRCDHVHPIADGTLTQALYRSGLRCPRCHFSLRPDRKNRRVACVSFPRCQYRDPWETFLSLRMCSLNGIHATASVTVERPRKSGHSTRNTRRSIHDSPGLSAEVIAKTVEIVREKQDHELVQHHHFQIRVAIQVADSRWKTSVAIVPRDARGAGMLVDVHAILFFDRSSDYATIYSGLEPWRCQP